jgi:hypothetical protein
VLHVEVDEGVGANPAVVAFEMASAASAAALASSSVGVGGL